MTFTKEISEQNKKMLIAARNIVGDSFHLTRIHYIEMAEKFPHVSADRIRGRSW